MHFPAYDGSRQNKNKITNNTTTENTAHISACKPKEHENPTTMTIITIKTKP